MTAPFRSAMSALFWAMNFEHRSHARAGATERAIALQARERYAHPALPTEWHGLRGLDAAAQAGMILAEIGKLGSVHRAVLVARFERACLHRQRTACYSLALYSRSCRALPSADRASLPALAILIGRSLGCRGDHGQIADAHDVDRRTVRRWQMIIGKWIQPIEMAAIGRAEDVLIAAKIVE